MPRWSVLLFLCSFYLPLFALTPISQPVERPAYGIQAVPSVAANDQDSLASWQDGRAAHRIGSLFPSDPQFDTYATRIDRNGRPFSMGGVAVNPTALQELSPAVIWNGSEYVVIQAEYGTIQDSTPQDRRVSFTRIHPDRIGQTTSIRLTPKPRGRLTAAWNGERYLVVTESDHGFGGGFVSIQFFVADENFRMIGSEASIVVPGAAMPYIDVAGSDRGFLVVWNVGFGDRRELHIAAVSEDGDVTSERLLAAFAPSFDRRTPAVVWNGSDYFVTWSDGNSIRGQSVTASGEPRGEAFVVMHAQESELLEPAVAWNGSVYLLTFSHRDVAGGATRLRAVTLSSEGMPVESARSLDVTDAQPFIISAVAASGSDFIVVWDRDADIVSTTVKAEGVGELRSLAQSVWRQGSLRSVSSGANLGFLWQESGRESARNSDRILFGRVTPQGERLDGAGIEVGQGSLARALVLADVYLAIWEAEGAALGKRFTRDGEALDETPLRFTSEGVAATDGESFLYVGTEAIPGPLPIKVLRVQAVRTAGSVSDPREVISPFAFDQIPLSLAWNGTQYLLVYRQYLQPLVCVRCHDFELRMVRLDREGRALSEPEVLSRHESGGVAGGPGTFLVWLGETISNPESSTALRLVDETGGVVSEAAVPFHVVDVEWTGSEFVLVGVQTDFSATTYEAFVQRVSSSGSPVRDPVSLPTHGFSDVSIVAARSSVAVIFPRVEPVVADHDAGIPRYVFDWLSPTRRRAVGR